MPTFAAPHAQDTRIRLHDVHWTRGGTPVFAGLSLDLKESRIGLIGDNGAGKSSLFRLLCGLDTPNRGQIMVNGSAVPEPPGSRRKVGLMFQNPDEQIIFPTVQEEMALGLTATGLTRREALAMVQADLQQRGLAHWAERSIGSLSQGQRQRVCWLSLLLMAPAWLLLDEPFASLDLPAQWVMQDEIRQLTPHVLLSTHQLNHVRDFERVIWLDQGQIRGDGPGAMVCAAYEADVRSRHLARQERC